MYKKVKMATTTARLNDSVEGETIEMKIERIVNNKEPITDGAPIVYTERKDGVRPGYDIRTDRFEIAIEAMDKVDKTHKAKRADAIKERQQALDELKNPKKGEKEVGGTEPTQGNQKTD